MKKKIFISFFMAIAVVAVGSISMAAIEIKPGTTTYTSIDVSSAYQLCYDLRANDTTLGNNSLDPHLTLNKDWGAVAYLGASAYGSARSDKGGKIDINGGNYYSTTGNKSGVINLGNYHTQTAAISKSRVNLSSYDEYRKNLIENIGKKYVETYEQTKLSGKGCAWNETRYWYSGSYNCRDIILRKGIFGLDDNSNGNDCAYGNAYSKVTFRPVIWN